MVLARVPVRAVNHETCVDPALLQHLHRLGHMLRLVVGAVVSPAEDQVAVLVALCENSRGMCYGYEYPCARVSGWEYVLT